MMSGILLRHIELYSVIQGDAVDCTEKMYLVEHGDSSTL
jgi:hypothetical protein